MRVEGRVPELALVVHVAEAFVHCGKSAIRARLWQPEHWPALEGLPSHARCLVDQAGSAARGLAQVEAEVREGYRSRLC